MGSDARPFKFEVFERSTGLIVKVKRVRYEYKYAYDRDRALKRFRETMLDASTCDTRKIDPAPPHRRTPPPKVRPAIVGEWKAHLARHGPTALRDLPKLRRAGSAAGFRTVSWPIWRAWVAEGHFHVFEQDGEVWFEQGAGFG